MLACLFHKTQGLKEGALCFSSLEVLDNSFCLKLYHFTVSVVSSAKVSGLHLWRSSHCHATVCGIFFWRLPLASHLLSSGPLVARKFHFPIFPPLLIVLSAISLTWWPSSDALYGLENQILHSDVTFHTRSKFVVHGPRSVYSCLIWTLDHSD